VIVKGVFALTTLSPKLKPYTVITDAQRAAIWGDLYTRLLTKDCRVEALLVLKVDGTSGVAVSLTPMQGAAVRTIEQEMNRYASSRGDNPAGYAREIAGRVGGGVTPDTRISSLTPAQREVVVQAIVTHEGATGTVRLIDP